MFNEMAPYFIATYNGFLVVEDIPGGRPRIYTDSDVRMASSWPTFEKADAVAKWAVGRLFPRDISYFAILCMPRWPLAPAISTPESETL